MRAISVLAIPLLKGIGKIRLGLPQQPSATRQ